MQFFQTDRKADQKHASVGETERELREQYPAYAQGTERKPQTGKYAQSGRISVKMGGTAGIYILSLQ